MATQTIALKEPRADGSPSAATVALPHPAVLGLGSGLLLWLSFPPAEWNWAAWFSLVPLFLLVVSQKSKRAIYFGSWLGGFAFWMLAIHWIWASDDEAWPGWVVMASILSLWWPTFLFLARFAKRRLNLPLILAAPILWVALEYVRAYALTGFPWYYLAHSQYKILYFTQIADFSGALGLSFLIATVNAYWVDLLTLPLFRGKAGGSWWVRLTRPQRARMVGVGLGLVGTLAYGAYRVETARFRDGPRVALLQSNEVNYTSVQPDKEVLQSRIEALVRKAATASPAPDLIVWPESGNQWGFVTIEPRLDEKIFDRLVKELHPDFIGADWTLRRERINDDFDDLMARTGIPMIVGSSHQEFKATGRARYNAAILFRQGFPNQVYHKLHLVPFGEYVPLVKTIPWVLWLTPFRDGKTIFLDHGSQPSWFDLGPYRLATAICFEDTLPHEVRRFFAEAPGGKQPDLLVNLSNDGWFKATSEHEMHLAVSVFRCIENRVPLARAVNTGISAMVDGNGRIVESLAKLKSGVLTVVAPLDDRVSFYSRWGDWLGLFCLASTLGLLILGTFSPRMVKSDPFPAPV